MESADKIIVFRTFGNAIDANIAKTKLDAYGIPCFLSDEYLANLYPLHDQKFGQVRLHLFSNDLDEAANVLDEVAPITDGEVRKCPRCRSTRVEMDFSKKIGSRLVMVLTALSFGILFPPKRVYFCKDCYHEF